MAGIDYGQIKVSYDDGREFVCALVPAILEDFEARATKRNVDLGVKPARFTIMDMLQNPGASEISFLGYEAARWLHRRGEHPGAIKPTYEDWRNILASVELVDDDVPLDETAT